jgi:hypothetical protein
MLTSDEKLKKMIIEEAINILKEAEEPGWLQHRLNALRARDWRRAGAGSMRDVQRGREGYEAAPGGSLHGYSPRAGFGGAMADIFSPQMRATVPEEEIAPEETWLPQEDLESLVPEDPTTERPPPLPIEALAQRKDIIVLPKSTVKLKTILEDLIDDAVAYANSQDPELENALETVGGDPRILKRFTDSIIMSVLRDLRSLNVGQYLKENINDFVYIKESTLKQMLYDIIKEEYGSGF